MKASLATDRSKTPTMREYRRMTSDEVRSNGHDWIYWIGRDGKVRQCRPSGALKTWKTRHGDYRLPVKFGLYESSALVPDSDNGELAAFEQSHGYYSHSARTDVLPVVEVQS